MGSSTAANLWVLLGLGVAGILLMTRKFKKTIKEDFGAFVERLKLLPPPQPAPPKAPHPLTNLTFAISDVFDVEGYVTGFGHPDWASSHGPASRTSPLVSTLVEGGATCVGKTVVDEMAYGVSGENKHYDPPTNAAAPSRVSGGCSSGAAVAVAANLVDFSLGLDTVGGVRVPAGYCGILGFRSSHGAVSLAGVIPVSSSLDTAGLFAKDPSVLQRVGHVLLQLPYSVKRNPRQITIADDCFGLSKIPSDRVAHVVSKSTEKLFGRLVLKHENIEGYLGSKVPSLKAFRAGLANGEDKTAPLRLLANVMKSIQRHEFIQNHGEWINSVKPTLNPIIPTAEFAEGGDGAEKEIENCQAVRKELRLALNSLLKDDGILVIPTVADPPPKLGGKEFLSEDYQCRAFSLLSIASLSGCCQVSVPLGFYEKIPVSVSFIAKQSSDSFLLDTVESMYASLQEQADIASNSKLSNSTIDQERSAEIAKEKGNQAFKDKQWTKAINLYTEAIKLCGNTATYYSNRAAAYLETGSFIQAEADCSKAISLDKKNVKAYLRRGTAREMLGYYKDAIEDFKYALILEPTNKRAAISADRLKKYFV